MKIAKLANSPSSKSTTLWLNNFLKLITKIIFSAFLCFQDKSSAESRWCQQTCLKLRNPNTYQQVTFMNVGNISILRSNTNWNFMQNVRVINVKQVCYSVFLPFSQQQLPDDATLSLSNISKVPFINILMNVYDCNMRSSECF